MGTEPNPPKIPTLSAVAGRREPRVAPKGDTPLSCFKIGRAITQRIPQGHSKVLTDLAPTMRAHESGSERAAANSPPTTHVSETKRTALSFFIVGLFATFAKKAKKSERIKNARAKYKRAQKKKDDVRPSLLFFYIRQ